MTFFVFLRKKLNLQILSSDLVNVQTSKYKYLKFDELVIYLKYIKNVLISKTTIQI